MSKKRRIRKTIIHDGKILHSTSGAAAELGYSKNYMRELANGTIRTTGSTVRAIDGTHKIGGRNYFDLEVVKRELGMLESGTQENTEKEKVLDDDFDI